jgi:hypothetical protein
MNHLAPRTGCDIRARKRVDGMLVNVVSTWTMFFGEGRDCFERVNNIADFWSLGDAVNVGDGLSPGYASGRSLRHRVFLSTIGKCCVVASDLEQSILEHASSTMPAFSPGSKDQRLPESSPSPSPP